MIKSKRNEKSAAMAALMAEYEDKLPVLRSVFSPGERLNALVLSVGNETIVCDIQSKMQGVLDRALYNDSEVPLPKEGDTIDVCFVEVQDGTARLALPGAAALATETIENAYAAKLTIEGKFDKEVKGGYEVTIAGQRAFCPFSQVAMYRPREGAPSPVGKTDTFIITEYNPRENTLVVSHRLVEETGRKEKREALKNSLFEGDLRIGKITKLMPFGAFVEIDGCIEGLIANQEISWDRSVKAADLLKEGDSVKVICRKIDWENNRFSFSLKDTEVDPWTEFAQNAQLGSYYKGKVVRLMQFGAFVQLVPGVDGLIPISRLGNGRALANASEAVSLGEELEVKIESIDPEAKRLSLSIVNQRVAALKPGEIGVGATLKGIVESVRPFGVFVRLSEEKTGLLHISEAGIERGGNAQFKLEKAFPVDSEVEVIVKGMEGDKISLTLPTTLAAREAEVKEAEDLRQMLRSNKEEIKNAGFGNLGSIFDAL